MTALDGNNHYSLNETTVSTCAWYVLVIFAWNDADLPRIIVLGQFTTYLAHVHFVKAFRIVYHRMFGASYTSGNVLTTWAAGSNGLNFVGISLRMLGMFWLSYLWKAFVESWCRPYPDVLIPQNVTFPNWAAIDRKRLSDSCGGRSAHASEQLPIGLMSVLTEA